MLDDYKISIGTFNLDKNGNIFSQRINNWYGIVYLYLSIRHIRCINKKQLRQVRPLIAVTTLTLICRVLHRNYGNYQSCSPADGIIIFTN